MSAAEAPADWLRDPAEIYRRSFAAIEAEAELGRLPPALRGVAVRLIHACGMTDLVDDLAFSGDPAGKGRAALESGAPVLCDATMVRAGITRRRLPAASEVLCLLDAPECAGLAERLGTTRSAAAVEAWRPRLDGAVVAIGNAPTALFHLIDRLRTWPERPAAIFAFPVGFVGAVESKEALIAAGLDVPFLTLRGRRGGSAMAAAAINALGIERP